MGSINVKVNLGQVDSDALQTDEEIRALARKLVPNALLEIGQASAEVMWKEIQNAFRGPGIKVNNSASDKHKFVENAGKEYARKATEGDRREIEDHIIAQIMAMKNEETPLPHADLSLYDQAEESETTMSNDGFPRRDVERAFRKFSDLASDLMRAQFQTWEEHLKCFLTFCETSAVMQIVTQPLRQNPNINLEQWHAEFAASVGSMVGSGRYTIPSNDDDRTALFYQVLQAFNDGRINAKNFAISAFGETRFQNMVDVINREFVAKFVREMQYRIRDIETDTQGQSEISKDALIVFHQYHGPVQHFENFQNSPISTGDVMGSGSQKFEDQSVTTGDLTNSNLVAHSSRVNQSISLPGDTKDILDRIVAILQTDSSLSEDDRQDSLQDVESLKMQLSKKKKDKGTMEKIIGSLEKVGPIASLAIKLLELIPAN